MGKPKKYLVDALPEARNIWDYEKNEESVESVGSATGRFVHWICSRGHRYRDRITVVVKDEGRCPYCSGKWITPGVNDFFADRPDLLNAWDEEKNGFPPVRDLKKCATREFWFICDKGHSYKRSPGGFTHGSGCGICSGRQIAVGVNDLATTHPEYLKMWDHKKNSKTPQEVTAGRAYKAWWLCDLGHSWQAAIYNTVGNKQGCPYCSHQKILPGFNDLFTLCPEAKEMFDSEKTDSSIDVSVLSRHSKENLWWVCDKGHNWEESPFKRIKNGKPNGCPYCSNKRISDSNSIASAYPEMAQYWDEEKNGISASKIFPGTIKVHHFKCNEGHSWRSQPNSLKRIIDDGREILCPYCFPRKVSRGEMEILDYIHSIVPEGTEVISSDRSVLVGTKLGPRPHELDIYIPDYKLAIEFNGLYWHSESMGKDRHYHRNKLLACRENGIHLVAVWEDEWRDKPEIVRSMLAHKLELSASPKVFARNTSVVPITSSQARKFLDAYHIQGFASGSVHLGLVDSSAGDLVAVSSWRKNKQVLYLDRYATSCPVVGGMGKLLKSAIQYGRDHNLEKIVTFSDDSISDGDLYHKLGFSYDGVLAPDYKYLVGLDRMHKFRYRIAKFKSDPSLIYKEGLTEAQLAELNGLERVWDYGKTRWVIDL